MKIIYDRTRSETPEIYLEAFTEKDFDLLRYIYTECETIGHGCIGDSSTVHHVRIALTQKGDV